MPPDRRHRVGSLREWSPSWGLLSRRKNPHPDPIWVLQMFLHIKFHGTALPAGRVLTRQGPRSSSSTAAGWSGAGSPTPAGRGCRTAPS